MITERKYKWTEEKGNDHTVDYFAMYHPCLSSLFTGGNGQTRMVLGR
jgi:hypothetical protein